MGRLSIFSEFHARSHHNHFARHSISSPSVQMLGNGDGILRVTPGRGRFFSPFGVCYCLSLLMFVLGLLGLSALVIATVSLNFPAVETKLAVTLNSTEVSDCQNEINLGNKGCADHFWRENRWKSLEWYVLHGLACMAPLAIMMMVWWLYYNDSRWLFWLMTIGWFLYIAVAGVTLGFDLFYILRCKKYEFCASPRYSLTPFTGVGAGKPDWAFILHIVSTAVVFLFMFFFWVVALFAQYYAATGKLAAMFAQSLRPASSSSSNEPKRHFKWGAYDTKKDPTAHHWFDVPRATQLPTSRSSWSDSVSQSNPMLKTSQY